jgi:hypothetical protein
MTSAAVSTTSLDAPLPLVERRARRWRRAAASPRSTSRALLLRWAARRGAARRGA